MLTLQAGESSLVLAPEIGGAIVGWTLGAVSLLRRPSPEAILQRRAGGLGCFPLVPFSNRIAWGKFRWADRDHQLDRNLGDHAHTIHGAGWQSRWHVAAVTRDAATLTLAYRPAELGARCWPFAFDAEQRFALSAEALRVTVLMINRDPVPAPAGLGLHPYFPLAGGATLRFAASKVWQNDADMLPVRCIELPPAWDHARGCTIGSVHLDNCFTDWDGTASISWAAGSALSITADQLFGNLIVYTPAGRDFFCLEPVSHATNAINQMDRETDHGLRTLAQGESLQGEVTFSTATHR